MTVINTNTASINAQYNLSKVNKEMESAMEALSSGKRINSAADDAAGLSIATRMESQVRGLNQAMRNAADGQSMVDTAEGAMDEITNMLQRMRELALQSASDTMSAQDRTNLNAEVDQLIAEIDRVTDTTTFNNKNLLDGTSGTQTLQIGNLSGETLAFSIGNMSSTALGTTLTAAASNAVTSNTAQGTAATPSIAQMAFNGNDSYGFTLTVGDGASGTDALTIAGASVSAGSATDVATKINTAIQTAVTAGTMASGAATATANGNVVTVTNALGDSIAISSFTSASNGTMSYTSVSGSGSSALLNDAAPVTALSNTGGGAATPSTGTLTLQSGKDYSFTVNGTNISVENLGTTTTEAALLAELKLAIGDGAAASSVTGQAFSLADSTGAAIDITNFQAVSSVAGSAGSMALTVRVDADTSTPSNTYANGGVDTTAIDGTDIVQLSFSEAEGDYQFDLGGETFTVATASASKSLEEALAVTRDAINANATVGVAGLVEARVVDGKLEIENVQAAGTAITLDGFSSTGKAAVTAGTATLGGTNLVTAQQASTTNGSEAVASETTMSFSKDDEYSFKIGGTLVTATITGGDLGNMVSAVNAQSDTTGVRASLSNGDLLLTNAAGGAIAITEFASTGTGIATAATAAGQGGSATLSDTAAVTGASTAAAGKASATTMNLSMDATDSVTFKISDGQTNAVVRLTSFDTTDNAAILAEINSALTNVGSNIAATVASGTSDVVLTNALGGKIELTNFTSDGAGVMTASPGSEQGVGKLLDDTGTAASQSAIAAINITSSAGANSAIDAIDRALEQINAQRSELGAVSNRLDHTINNLGNVVVNTEASQSRIEDADFAKVTGDLTKSQIMSQAATAMLAQANASKQGVLSLLQG
ncbi:flagellin [Celeribacter marinus]|uniref:Flagellin n=1 Tax=Celeribacter marinus TaxID=1397108 RepID=A0A0N9ZVT2_9RHOB|nr:flagellin [Celeribacter marinus]ALI54078.1 flagellin protein FlaA [Celeribacter marinus]